MGNFLHGVETVDVKKGATPVRVVKTAVIGLVGIAPTGPVNVPTLCIGQADFAQFGSQVPGFTIPQALADIAAQGAGTVVVVNVFNETDHTTAVTNEVVTIASGKGKLSYAPIGASFALKSNDLSTTYVRGTDYTVDEYGNVKVLSTAIANGSDPKATYKRLNAAAVTASTIIGTVNGTTNVRTGMKCFDLVKSTWGFNVRKLIAPWFSSLAAVKAEMIVKARAYKGHAYIDAPQGVTPSVAIAGRGGSGAAVNFQTDDKRAVLFYPGALVYDQATDSNVYHPLSAIAAGMRAFVMENPSEGPHFSSSNHTIQGIIGPDQVITADLSDPTTEANALNENGIVTVFNAFGTGIRLWGNRTAAWPTNAHPENFEACQDVDDLIVMSIEQASLQYIDKPGNPARIDQVVETVNSFLDTLRGRGWIVNGSCSFDPVKNPATEMALGHYTFDYEFVAPTPMERVTFNKFVNINLLNAQ